MFRHRRVLLRGGSLVALVGALSLPIASGGALGQGPSGPASPPVEVTAAIQHDVSPPLRDMRSGRRSDVPREHPLRPIPANVLAHQPPDPVVQSSTLPNVSATNGQNFAGVGNGDYGFAPNAAPPDTNGAVGATQYVQWVNESFAVFDKTGALKLGPVAGNTLWAGFGGNCETRNDGDPIVQYDKMAMRWVLTQFSVPNGGPYEQCVAVSQTSDATGAYYRYSFSYGSTQFNDYPKLGVWPDGYYLTYNIFNNGSTFGGSKLCALDRTAMLAGSAATQQCFLLSTSFGGVLPSDFDGTTRPPSGSPNYMLNFGTNSLNEWKFHADFATPANATLTGPINIPVAAFTPACGGGTCIPQPGTSNKLDSLADRLMYRLAYRTDADTGIEHLVVNHSVKVSGTKRGEVDGIRWYELRKPSGNTGFSVYQRGTYSPADGMSRWMGSIAMDKLGNIALGYSASSSSVFPSIRYTGRVPGDALGTMEGENSILAGAGSQTGNLHRWGDYSSMTVDPVDDCTFWFTTEYLKSSGSFNWSTRIASFKMPGC